MSFDIILILFLLNFLILFSYKKICIFFNIYDYPDEDRKIHKSPVPLVSFIFFLSNIFFFLIYSFLLKDLNYVYEKFFFITNKQFFIFLVSLISLTLVGLYDDKFKISVYKKSALILIILFFNIYIDTGLQIRSVESQIFEKNITINNSSVFFSLFCFFVLINVMNMFDGINTQSINYFLIIFIFLFFKKVFTEINLLLIISLLFILYLNIKNKIFLGDAGIYICSYFLSYMLIKANNYFYSFKAEEIILILLLPALDMIRLFCVRLNKNISPFLPDSNHIHHRLLKKFGFKKSLIIIFSIVVLQFIFLFFIPKFIIYAIFTIFLIYMFLIYVTKKV